MCSGPIACWSSTPSTRSSRRAVARALDRWRPLAEPWRSAAREALLRVAAKPDLSDDTREIVTKSLQD